MAKDPRDAELDSLLDEPLPTTMISGLRGIDDYLSIMEQLYAQLGKYPQNKYDGERGQMSFSSNVEVDTNFLTQDGFGVRAMPQMPAPDRRQ